MRRHSIPDLLPWQTFTWMGTDCISLCQDLEGAVWCGSASGLCRFDGKVRQNFAPTDGLPQGHIEHLVADGTNTIWLGAVGRHGKRVPDSLATMEGGRCRVFGPADGWPGWRVTGLASQHNRVWIATEGGVVLAENGSFRAYTTSDGLISGLANCILVRGDGSVWVGTNLGIAIIDQARIRHLTTADGLPSAAVIDLAEDRQGRLWVALADGLACRDGSTFSLWTMHDGLTTAPVHTVCVDSQDRVWTGSNAGQGACSFDGEAFTPVSTSSGMPHNNVSRIIADREGGLLFAFNHGGVARLDVTGPVRISDDPVPEAACFSREGTLWWASGEHVTRHDGAGTHGLWRVADHVTAIHADRRRRLWIGTASSLSVADLSRTANQPAHVTLGSGGNDQVSSLGEDASGTMWITARGRGAFIYDDTEEVAIHVPSILDTSPASNVMVDSRGRLWAFDWRRETDGIWLQEGATRTRFSTEEGLPDNRVSCMFEDRSGQIWAGTLDGPACFDGAKFIAISPGSDFAGRAVQCMTQDCRGHMWIGFLGGGIARYDGRNFQFLSTADGLPSDRITGIFEDHDLNMLITTYKGVCRYTPEDAAPPSVQIDMVETSRMHNRGSVVRMPASVPSLRIHFHGVSLKTRRMRYTYMLDGYDKDWRATSSDEVRYERLPPGPYTFRVMAINRDLVYTRNPAEVRIEVVRNPKEQRLTELEKEVRTLEGLLQICSVCKRILNDTREWEQLEVYLSRRSMADFSHGYCPDCAAKAESDVRESGGNT